MRIQSDRLKLRALLAGVTVDALAQALPSSGGGERKQAEQAKTKVRNWMAGRDHPRCKASDIAAMARALGCEPKDISRFTCTHRFARSSERKSGLVADLIRGRSVVEADALLEFSPRRAAVMVRKALESAKSQAESAGVSLDRAFVAESRVDRGVIIKRFQPKDRGRALGRDHQALRATL